jgi:hypothetical protein
MFVIAMSMSGFDASAMTADTAPNINVFVSPPFFFLFFRVAAAAAFCWFRIQLNAKSFSCSCAIGVIPFSDINFIFDKDDVGSSHINYINN